jgi:The  BURPS668_1122 family of deaminases
MVNQAKIEMERENTITAKSNNDSESVGYAKQIIRDNHLITKLKLDAEDSQMTIDAIANAIDQDTVQQTIQENIVGVQEHKNNQAKLQMKIDQLKHELKFTYEGSGQYNELIEKIQKLERSIAFETKCINGRNFVIYALNEQWKEAEKPSNETDAPNLQDSKQYATDIVVKEGIIVELGLDQRETKILIDSISNSIDENNINTRVESYIRDRQKYQADGEKLEQSILRLKEQLKYTYEYSNEYNHLVEQIQGLEKAMLNQFKYVRCCNFIALALLRRQREIIERENLEGEGNNNRRSEFQRELENWEYSINNSNIKNPEQINAIKEKLKAECQPLRDEFMETKARELADIQRKFNAGEYKTVQQYQNDLAKWKSDGNFAVAHAKIQGLDQEYYKAFSNYQIFGDLNYSSWNQPGQGQVSVSEVAQAGGGNFSGNRTNQYDTERAILNDIDSRLNGNRSSTGEVIIYTELKPCSACVQSKTDFQSKYPNIQVTFVDKKGNVYM